jgi:CBS domain-containing protein
MTLELSEIERCDLQTALDVHLVSLRNEFAHTDDRSYRRTVRDTIDHLEAIAGRLGRERASRRPGAASNGKSLAAWVKDLMHTHPLTALREDLVLDVAARMAEHGVRHMPVTDAAGRLVGIISDRDVRQAIGTPMRLAADGVMPEALVGLTVGAIMSADTISVTGDVLLADVARLFANKPIGAVPVVDGEQRVIGIVSYMDVLSKLAR